MKNKLIITITIFLTSFSTMQISAYQPYSTPSSAQGFRKHGKTAESKINGKSRAKKPTYYRGHSDGLQNYPGKTIDAGMNTGMLPTNSASHSGNDVSF